MKTEHFESGTAAILLAALIYFIADVDKILAVLIPVVVHELGHVLTLRLLGLRINGFKAELKGFCIGYCGYTGALGHVLAAAAGPMFGLLYAMSASILAERLGSGWLELSAGVSLLLSLFNLLPALPLDGGRIVYTFSSTLLGESAGARLCNILGLTIGVILLFSGVWLMLHGCGVALELSAVWLLAYTGISPAARLSGQKELI